MMRAFRGEKLDGVVPAEFQTEMAMVKETRDYTQEVVKCMQRIVHTAPQGKSIVPIGKKKVTAQQMDELQKLSQTCEKSMHSFYEQRYYFVLKTTAEACQQLSKHQREIIKNIYDRSMVPMKLWVEEDYPRLYKDLKQCTKMKKEADAAAVALAAQPTPEREAKAAATKEAHEQQYKICQGEMDKTRKVRKHHADCLKLMCSLQYKYSKTSLEEIEKAQAQLKKQLSSLDGQEKSKASPVNNNE
ncbi:hypothetical protein M3Y95_00945700 [Aphelenchoides besseyi]|nr:hypothetical protein M3Y95_00945700 [Aphelenchoides besseyi]